MRKSRKPLQQQKIARIIEKIFFPVNVGIVGIIIFMFYTRSSPFFFNQIILFIVSLLSYFLARRFSGRYAKTETKEYTIAAFVGIATFIIFSYFFPVSKEFWFGFSNLIILVLLVHFLRDKWKISGHVVGYTTVTVMLSLLLDIKFLLLFVFLPLIVWGRIKLKRHSNYQILGGILAGLLIPTILYFTFSNFLLL